jgi:CheY-like chemotaxis protein
MLARGLQEALGAQRFHLHSTPPREEIARCLLQGEYVLVDGDLPSAAERRDIASIATGALGASGVGGAGAGSARCLFVEWQCGRSEAEREIFHRYAGRPRCLAEVELERYLADAARREPALEDIEGEPLIVVSSAAPLDAQLEAVVCQLEPRRCTPDGKLRPRVLVVEDDVEERMVLAEVLRELGWAVELAPDAAVALALLEAGVEIELVLTDHRMPGMTGVELARELWERHPSVRAVLLTAYDDDLTCAGAVDAHAVTVLSKPVHILDLTRVLDEAQVA